MYGKVIVAFNASAESEDALAFGAALRGSLGSRLTVVSCVVDSFGRPGGHYVNMLRREANESLATARSELDEDRGVEFRLATGRTAAAALHDLAERIRADLVVVGTTHRRRGTEMVSHSVTHKVIETASCPVAVAPVGFRDRASLQLGTLAVAYDDSPEATEALLQAAALAEACGARLKVVHAYRPAPSSGPLFLTYGEPDEAEASHQRALDRLEQAVRLVPEVDVRPALVEGDAVRAILDASHEADLLFMGSRAYGPLMRAVVASVSGRVVRAAECPAIVVPRPIVQMAHSAA